MNAIDTNIWVHSHDIQDAVAVRERLVLVVGPKAAVSDNVRPEWPFALQADKAVTRSRMARVGRFG
jgi:hypothetical protein